MAIARPCSRRDTPATLVRLTSALALSATLFGSSRVRAETPNAGFGSAGDVVISADRMADVVLVERAPSSTVVAFGDSLSDAPVDRAPRLSLDFAPLSHLTLGASLLGASRFVPRADHAAVWGLSPRIGLAMPLGGVAALWPRAGATLVGGDARVVAATIETELAIFLVRGAALTASPSVDVPLGSSSSPLRVTLTAGLLGHTGGAAQGPDHAARDLGSRGTIIVSADRLIPLFSSSRSGRAPQVDAGLTHAFDRGNGTRSSLGVDVVVGRGVTLGGTIDVNLVPYDDVSTAEVGAMFGVEPRVGWIAPVGRDVALWFRSGAAYRTAIAEADGWARAYELELTLDTEGVFFPVPGFGLALGPTFGATVLSGTRGAHVPLANIGAPLVRLGMAGALLLTF